MPSKMLAAGENHPTVAKALALKRFCWCGAIAFARRGKGYLLWVAVSGIGTVRVGLRVGSIDGRGRDTARGGRVEKGRRGGDSSSSGGGGDGGSSVGTEYAGVVDGELEGSGGG